MYSKVLQLRSLRGHLVYSSPPQQQMTFDFERFLTHVLIITFWSCLNFWERASISLFMCAKQENYWYHFYNLFGMTRSLTGDWRSCTCIQHYH